VTRRRRIRGRKRLAVGLVAGALIGAATVICRHFAPGPWQGLCAAVAPIAQAVRSALGV
jgi:hypothetical protein